MDHLPSPSSSLAVRLVVGAGNHAGVIAEIREGLYMIGRDRECQIRPKSTSVSDRHCLVHHAQGSVRVFDLGSEAGTFINDQLIAPKSWHLLHHGDRLRCGRYWFEVAIYSREETHSELPSDSSEVVIGEDVIDVATARELTNQAQVVELFEDEDFELFGTDPASRAAGGVACDDTVDEDSNAQPSSSTSVKSRRPKLPSRLPVAKIPRGTSGGGIAISWPENLSWQTIGAVLLTIGILSYSGYTLFQLQKGEPAKVVNGID